MKDIFAWGNRFVFQRTRWAWRTLDSRGKSFTPESRMLMDESRSCKEDWRDDTEEDREEAILYDGICGLKRHVAVILKFHELFEFWLFTLFTRIVVELLKEVRLYSRAGNSEKLRTMVFFRSLLEPHPKLLHQLFSNKIKKENTNQVNSTPFHQLTQIAIHYAYPSEEVPCPRRYDTYPFNVWIGVIGKNRDANDWPVGKPMAPFYAAGMLNLSILLLSTIWRKKKKISLKLRIHYYFSKCNGWPFHIPPVLTISGKQVSSSFTVLTPSPTLWARVSEPLLLGISWKKISLRHIYEDATWKYRLGS